MAKKNEIAQAEGSLQKSNNSVEMTHDKPVYIPATDIYEGKDDILVYADMPGVSEKNVEVTLEDETLTLIGHQNADAPEDMELLYNGYRPGIFRREFTLGKAVNRQKVKARMENGVLTLTLPKAEEVKPRKIAINVG